MAENLQISEEHKELLISVIKECPKYFEHSELLDEFIVKTYQKSYLLIGAIKDKARLRRHLLNIAQGVISEVLKDKKIVDEQILYNHIKNNPEKRQNIISLKDELPNQFKVGNEIVQDIRSVDDNNYYDEGQSDVVTLQGEIQTNEQFKGASKLDDPIENIEENEVSSNTIDKLLHMIRLIDLKNPDEKYFEIFTYRYLKKYSQSEIAQVIGITQIELSKRFIELMEKIKEFI